MYPLHIILRYDIERRLFDGSLRVEDVPSFWKDRMQSDLGVEIQDDAEGCLQDIHWAFGAVGYFPSYSLGAIMAAQFFQAAEQDLPDLREHIAAGDFAMLREWLSANVHQVGSLYESPDELLQRVTGRSIDVSVYLDYLTKKYEALYDL